MVEITYVYIDTIFAFYGYILFFFLFIPIFSCLIGCLSIIGHNLFWVSYMHVLDFSICTCSGHLSMFHMERGSRNMIIIIIILIVLTVPLNDCCSVCRDQWDRLAYLDRLDQVVRWSVRLILSVV